MILEQEAMRPALESAAKAAQQRYIETNDAQEAVAAALAVYLTHEAIVALAQEAARKRRSVMLAITPVIG